MRQWPGENMVTIKRNFYPRSGAEQRLDEMISVRKGVYSAFRLGEVRVGVCFPLHECPLTQISRMTLQVLPWV